MTVGMEFRGWMARGRVSTFVDTASPSAGGVSVQTDTWRNAIQRRNYIPCVTRA